MSTETINEVTAEELKNIDGIVLVDKSGSMGEPSLRMQGKTKWEELREDVGAVAREIGKYDADGITLVVFSGSPSVVDGVTAASVSTVFQENQPRGSTNLADALKAAVEKAKSSSKQAVVFVYTDGSPDSQQDAVNVIEKAGKDLGRPKIGFVFIQVGNDAGAASFLKYLDTAMSVDVCATVSAKDAENLSVPQLAWLARNK